MKTELDKAWILARETYARLERARAAWGSISEIKLDMAGTWCGHEVAWDTWQKTVYRVCGSDASIEETNTGCIVLGVMEFFYEN